LTRGSSANIHSIMSADAAKPPLPPPEEYVWHTVGPRDTVLGLSLIYKTSVSVILQANDLPSSGNLALLPRVKIPRAAQPVGPLDAEASQRAKVREFRVRNGLPEAEAKYYLLEADWDLAAAQEVLRGHLAFEAGAGGYRGQAVVGGDGVSYGAGGAGGSGGGGGGVGGGFGSSSAGFGSSSAGFGGGSGSIGGGSGTGGARGSAGAAAAAAAGRTAAASAAASAAAPQQQRVGSDDEESSPLVKVGTGNLRRRKQGES
jgi:hypothetical protein